MTNNEILFFEELQSNAFPALQSLHYDGWDVRFGGGFTYRVNCANPLYPEKLPAAEKIEFVETLYKNSSLDKSIIKLHDGMEAAQLAACEGLLNEKGYSSERRGNIFLCDLANFQASPKASVDISACMSDNWLSGFLQMNGTADQQYSAACSMLKNIYYPIAAASIYENGKMVACGLGVIERGYIGLYDIYVDAACRRRGLGLDICSAIMAYGKENGCHTAYLQVLSDNSGARALYKRLGYYETYEYWYRVKRL